MKVTLEQYKLDLHNTVKECQAYEKLRDGFKLLSELPENSALRPIYTSKSKRHHTSMIRCEEFYEDLMNVRLEDLE